MNTKIKTHYLVATLIAATLVASCGGGDDDTSANKTTNAIAPVQTTASQGNLGFYGGTWRSGCGFVTISSGAVKSAINTYTFPTTNATTAAVVIEQRQFSDTSCAVAWPSAIAPPITGTVVFKYVGTHTLPASTGTSPKYAGQADIVEITTSTPGGTPTVETKHMAVDANDVLHITKTDDLSGSALTYSRVQLPK